MLTLYINESEVYIESTSEFVTVKPCKLVLEHSLLSISKWEAKWKKSYLHEVQKTREEFIDYIKCMTIGNVDDIVYAGLSNDNINAVINYINDSMTATTFTDKGKRSREIITSEIIYYWMIEFGIPFECEKWHINRLLTLITVCSIKSSDPKKMPMKDAMRQQRMLNSQRQKRFNPKL